MGFPTRPWSANAFNVLSGMVFTVSGAARASMYRTSEAFGSLVPVLANSRRCARAPALSSADSAGRRDQLAIRLVGALRDRDAEPIAERGRHLARYGDIPAADEHGRHRGYVGIEAGGDAPFDAAQVGVGRREVMLAREQQRDVDRNAAENRLLDRGQSFARAGNLDEQIAPGGARMQIPRCRDRGLAVVREQG